MREKTLAGGAVERMGSARSDFGLGVLRPIGRMGTIPRALATAKEKLSGTLWSLRAWQILLFSISFLVLPSQSGAADQEPAPPVAPVVEFTVQSGHTAEIQ